MRGKLLSVDVAATMYRITPADAGKTSKQCPLSDIAPDHPRGCGENAARLRVRSPKNGSPPRMRGKPPESRRIRCNGRITPADAGKTLLLFFVPVCFSDHPRGCGENFLPHFDMLLLCGSPPRMRGKPPQHSWKRLLLRITPADAGKTSRTKRKRCSA